jgi:hypothetical protein
MEARVPVKLKPAIPVLAFFARLKWIDGTPLLDHIEPYRQRLFEQLLDTRRHDGSPQYNLCLIGRAKKNWKSADLVLIGLFKLICGEAPQGNDVLLLSNDEDQSNQNLRLAKKLVAVNPDLAAELTSYKRELSRKDGDGVMEVLASDVPGSHGRTAACILWDEIHAFRDWGLIEALQPDPTRADALQCFATYDTIYDTEGCPLHDLKQIAKAGTDPRMLTSWYSADWCTDSDFADLSPELRANPSMGSWADSDYLEQQKRRLPHHKYRRLHLNLPGAAEGAYLDQGMILRAVVNGRLSLPPQDHVRYQAFVDLSHGSQDDAVLSIAHREGKKVVVDLVVSQSGRPPFSANDAIKKFAGILHQFHTSAVSGDAVGGQTYRLEFAKYEIGYKVCDLSTSDLYEQFEVMLNNGEVELPDQAKLIQQLVLLVMKGAKITHPSGEHDDWSTAVSGAVYLARHRLMFISESVRAWSRINQRGSLENPGWKSLGRRAPTVVSSHARPYGGGIS